MLRHIWGDDIFISYSRSDGASYAAGLAAALAQRKFSCKFDQWGSHPGREIPPNLIRALERSNTLVLVGSPGAAASDAVYQEVNRFLRTKRLIVPIDFEGASQQAKWWPLVQGLPWSSEPLAALGTGEPDEAVINRVDKTTAFPASRMATTPAPAAAMSRMTSTPAVQNATRRSR